MKTDDIMEDPVYELAIDFLQNGGDLPAKVTNKFVAALVKLVYGQAERAKEEAAKSKEISLKNQETIAELIKAPSLTWYIRNRPWRSLAATFSFIGAAIVLWFILHAFATIPGVEAWFIEVFKIPVP